MLLHRRPASKKPFVLNCTVVHASLYSQECLFEELQTQERLNECTLTFHAVPDKLPSLEIEMERDAIMARNGNLNLAC